MTVTEIASEIKNLKSALIFCHVRPDGDTLSCAFALYCALKKLGKTVDIVCGDGMPDKYEKCFPFAPKTKPEGSYDGYIAVDVATLDMMGLPGEFFAKQKKTYCIDHHTSNTRYAKTYYVEEAPACAVILYEVIKALGVEIDKEIASLLLVGVCADTGNFAHADVDAKTLEIGAKLVEAGANIGETYDKLFRSQSKARAELYASVMSGMKFYLDDKLAIINVKQSDLSRLGLDRSATEGFIDFPMTISSVEVAISVLEQKNGTYKLSFRSKGVDVNQIAATFGGGGHKLASGAMLAGYYEDVIDKLVFTVGNYL